MQILLSNSQAGPGRTVKQGQEEISRNHVQTFISPSVHTGKFQKGPMYRYLLELRSVDCNKPPRLALTIIAHNFDAAERQSKAAVLVWAATAAASSNTSLMG